MDKALIAVGTGVGSCVSTVFLMCAGRPRNPLLSVMITAIASGALGLTATYYTKDHSADQSRSLSKRDYIIVGGARAIGAAAGGVAVVAVAVAVHAVVGVRIVGSLIANLCCLPLYCVAVGLGGGRHFHPIQPSSVTHQWQWF